MYSSDSNEIKEWVSRLPIGIKYADFLLSLYTGELKPSHSQPNLLKGPLELDASALVLFESVGDNKDVIYSLYEIADMGRFGKGIHIRLLQITNDARSIDKSLGYVR